MSRDMAHRPFLFGERDRRVFRVDMCEIAVRCINDGNGNPVYVGFAQVGTATSSPYWQIRKITYDGNNAVTEVQWPENDVNQPSNNYEFIWDDYLSYTYF